MSRKDKQQSLNLRSEEVQEILSNPPSWIVRWGITLIFAFVCILIALSIIIKYPDFISAKVLITTKNPTEKVVVRSSGQIEQLFVINGEPVKKGQKLAVIKSTAKYEDLTTLLKIVDTLDVTDNTFHFPLETIAKLSLGELEPAFLEFEKNYLEFKLLNELYPYQNRLIGEKISLLEIKKQLSKQLDRRKILEKELELKLAEFNRYRILFQKGVISKQEFESKELSLLQIKKNINDVIISVSQMREALASANQSLRTTYIDKELEHARSKKNLQQSFNSLKYAINDWKYKYFLVSSIDGIVSFNEFWGENQEVNASDIIFTILPEKKSDLLGKLTISSQNAGKVNVDQKVMIKLDNFPYQQYGMVIGKVKNVSISPDSEGKYIVYISFNENMKTSYNLQIEYKQEMLGNAEIITEDLSLAERLFFKVKDLFKF